MTQRHRSGSEPEEEKLNYVFKDKECKKSKAKKQPYGEASGGTTKQLPNYYR